MVQVTIAHFAALLFSISGFFVQAQDTDRRISLRDLLDYDLVEYNLVRRLINEIEARSPVDDPPHQMPRPVRSNTDPVRTTLRGGSRPSSPRRQSSVSSNTSRRPQEAGVSNDVLPPEPPRPRPPPPAAAERAQSPDKAHHWLAKAADQFAEKPIDTGIKTAVAGAALGGIATASNAGLGVTTASSVGGVVAAVNNAKNEQQTTRDKQRSEGKDPGRPGDKLRAKVAKAMSVVTGNPRTNSNQGSNIVRRSLSDEELGLLFKGLAVREYLNDDADDFV